MDDSQACSESSTSFRQKPSSDSTKKSVIIKIPHCGAYFSHLREIHNYAEKKNKDRYTTFAATQGKTNKLRLLLKQD